MKIYRKYSKYIYALLFLLVAWYSASYITNMPIIPAPNKVFTNLVEIFGPKMVVHVIYSLIRMFAGLLLSLIIGMSLGLTMGYSDALDKILSPIIYFLYPIPKIALLPIVMLLFGLNELSKIVMIILIVVFQIIIAARDSVKAIPKETFYSLNSLGASRYNIFKEVIIPASLPRVLTSIRIGLGTSMSVLFFTETFGTQYGLGFFIMDSWMRINYVEMYSGIITLSSLGFLLFVIIDSIEAIVCAWNNKEYSK